MSFRLKHTLISRKFIPEERGGSLTVPPDKESGPTFFAVNLEGEFQVLFPGPLTRVLSATFVHRINIPSSSGATTSVRDPPPTPGGSAGRGRPTRGTTPPSTPGPDGVSLQTKNIDLKLEIFSPDGQVFKGSRITLAHLRNFRDQRGVAGPWKYRLTGESERIVVTENSRVSEAQGEVSLTLLETIASESAPPLVDNEPIRRAPRSFSFDLFRVGSFVAEIRPSLLRAWRGSMRLLDPDGNEVKRTTARVLRFDVDLPTLDKSRDTVGRVRKWTLEVAPSGAMGVGRVSATVIGTARITISELKSRIDTMLGANGEFIKIFGEDKGAEALLRLKITDLVSAETIDMHDLVESTLLATQQDPGVREDLLNNGLQSGVVYTLFRKPGIEKAAGVELSVKVGSFKVTSINVDIGPGEKLGKSVPAVKLAVGVSGKVKIKKGGVVIADIEVPGNKIKIEIGMKVAADGTPQFVTSVPDTVFDGDLATGAAAVLAGSGLAGGALALAIENFVDNKVEDDFNDPLVKTIRDMFATPTLAPSIFMMIFGAHLTYKRIGFSNGAIVFDHIAPLEPDPRPSPGYHGAIGRAFKQSPPNVISFEQSLGDTWSAENLKKKIDHVVVVMMENRSYDHVLGYRARAPFLDGARGLSREQMIAFASAADGPFDVHNLNDARFARNSLGLMTRLPVGVGHSFDDVKQQLSKKTTALDGRLINSPRGFVDNYAPLLEPKPGKIPLGVVADDVLGFYDAAALPFYSFLAENYAYTDRYYSSHPGPTLPNRMYSLTGDVQRDRYGFPILDNNDGDNFLLSRAPTIYDLMARKRLRFRVYESRPSVTMLRMFARYATDDVNIRPLGDKAANLKADILADVDLPALIVVEPQMHAHPQDDDHPVADMHRGQIFLKNVYEALTSNPKVWERTMLIITYDEHGGFYDHVIPPVADVFTRPGKRAINPNLGASKPAGGAVLASGGRRRIAAAPNPTPAPKPRRGSFAFNPTLSPKVLEALGSLPQLMQAPLEVPYGVRVPTFVVSPWTTPGNRSDRVLDHCSILKTILARFFDGKPFLSDRVSASNSFDGFLTATVPRMDVPRFGTLGDLKETERKRLTKKSAIITDPLKRAAMRAGPVDYHDLMGRWARQLGR